MNDTINLLVHDDTPKPSETKGLKALRGIALGSFVVTLLVSFAFLLLIIFSPLPGLTDQKDTLVKQVSGEKFISMLSLSDRLTTISAVIAKRPPYEILLEKLQSQIPEGATMHTIKMDGNAVSFGISSSSLEFLDTFIANIKSLNKQGTKVYRTLSLTNLTYNNQQNTYLLTIDMTSL
ncbi:hypothetical protein BH11PAT1_BH11PAT1_3100 [soil metagenome]